MKRFFWQYAGVVCETRAGAVSVVFMQDQRARVRSRLYACLYESFVASGRRRRTPSRRSYYLRFVSTLPCNKLPSSLSDMRMGEVQLPIIYLVIFCVSCIEVVVTTVVVVPAKQR